MLIYSTYIKSGYLDSVQIRPRAAGSPSRCESTQMFKVFIARNRLVSQTDDTLEMSRII